MAKKTKKVVPLSHEERNLLDSMLAVADKVKQQKSRVDSLRKRLAVEVKELRRLERQPLEMLEPLPLIDQSGAAAS